MAAYFWDNPTIILFYIIAVLGLDKLWRMYLLTRQLAIVFRVEEVPELLVPYLSQSEFSRMRNWYLETNWFLVVNTLLTVVICGCLELLFGFYAFVWRVACKCSLAKWMDHEVWLSIVYIVLLSIYLKLKRLPGALYKKFYLPRRLRQKRTVLLSRRTFTVILCTLLALALMCLGAILLVFLVLGMGVYSFVGMLVLALLLTGLYTLFQLLAPAIIDRFYGEKQPLDDYEELRNELKPLTESVGFPIKRVFVIKTFDPSMGGNAFFTGHCCSKGIYIFDTLLLNKGLRDSLEMELNLEPYDLGKGLTNAQVAAVVAHELGHWKHGHFYKALLVHVLKLLFTLILICLCFSHGPIYQAVGFEKNVQPIVVGFYVIFFFVLTPYITFSDLFLACVTRHFEYQADRFAYNEGYTNNLKLALLKLYADNLMYPLSDRCYSCWKHSHPTLMDRLRAFDKLDSRSKK